MKSLICIIVLFVLASTASAQDDVNLFNYWEYYTDAENAMYKTSCELAFDQLVQREQEIANLNARQEYLNRQHLVRAKLTKIIGPLPEKTPLNARITGVIKEKDYRVEKIVFESIPQYYVTAALFLPVPGKGKLPVVIYASGHTANGFRSETYQHIIINLVKKGFAVFAFDPVGQGERWQYFDESGKKRFGSTTIEHSYPGAQCYISGYSPTNYFVWDGIRAVDYLLTRKEIDPDRIGMTGRSGGGTQTAYTAAMDPRILAAAPECFITSMEYVLKSIGPQDAEQNLYHMISEGLDHADLLEVRAPKPTLMITTTRDYFSIQGARETFAEVKQFYQELGAADQVNMVEDDEGHASTKKNREAMYSFFQKHLNNPGSPQDMEVEVFKESDLWVTEAGQVATSLKGETLFSLNRKVVDDQVKQLSNARDTRKRPQDVIAGAIEISGFEYPESLGQAVFSGRTQQSGYNLETYLVPGSGNYQLPVGWYIPLNGQKKEVVMIFDQQGMEHAADSTGLTHQLVEQGYSVIVADLPGIGSLGPGYLKGDAYVDNTSFNQWFAGIMTAKSIVALRAEDIIRLVKFIQLHSESEITVSGISTGPLGSDLLHAAAFEDGIASTVLIGSFLSYAEIASAPEYQASFITSVVAGAVNEYDLPDLMAVLSPRKLFLVNPLKPTGEEYGSNDGSILLEYPVKFYTAAGTSLTTSYGVSQSQISTSILKWLD